MNAERRRFYARSGDQRSQQFRLRSHDANLVVDFDTLRQRAHVVAAVAAIVEAYAFAGLPGEPLKHIRGDALIARTVERELHALGFGGGLIPQCLEARHALLRHGVVLVDHSRLNSVKETAEALVGFRDSPVKLGKVFAAALGALLPAVDDTGEHGFQPLGLEQAIPDMIGDQMVQLVHWNRAALAAGLALPCLGRTGVIAVGRACAAPAGAECHRAPAFGAEADAGQQRGTAGDTRGRHHGIAGFEASLHRVVNLALDQGRHRHDGNLALWLLLPVLMRARVEPVLSDIGGASEDGVDLRQPPAPAITGEETALVKVGGDGLDAHRAGRAIAFKEQAIDQPHSVGVLNRPGFPGE